MQHLIIMNNQVKSVIESIKSLSELSLSGEKYRPLAALLPSLLWYTADNGSVVIVSVSDDASDYDAPRKVLGFGNPEKFTSLVGGSYYMPNDAYKCQEDALKAFRDCDKYFQDAAGKPGSFNGGSVTYKPAFIQIHRYGFTVWGFKECCVIT
jgi:hypothetical protein